MTVAVAAFIRRPRRPPDLTNEERLCLLLARGRLSQVVQDRALELLRARPRWERILELAAANGVLPLLEHSLRTLGFPGVPQDVQAELTRTRFMNALRSRLMVDELTRVLERFHTAGVPVVPLKGVALAAGVYGDPALRVSSDIDLLVPSDAVPRALDLVVSAGYEPIRPHDLRPATLELLLSGNIECAFVPRDRKLTFPLELHWDVAWKWRADGAIARTLWEEAHPSTVLGAPAHILSPEGELLFLAVHAARHRWGLLKWLVDVHELCSSGAVDWQKVERKASRLGLDKVLRLTCGACVALFDTPIPSHALPKALPAWLRLFPSEPPALDVWKNALLSSRFLTRRRDKLRYLARVLFLPSLSDHRLLPLPAYARPILYAARPLRLLGRAFLQVVRRWGQIHRRNDALRLRDVWTEEWPRRERRQAARA